MEDIQKRMCAIAMEKTKMRCGMMEMVIVLKKKMSKSTSLKVFGWLTSCICSLYIHLYVQII